MTDAAVTRSGAAWKINDLEADRTELQTWPSNARNRSRRWRACTTGWPGAAGVQPWDEGQRDTPGTRP